MAKVGFIKIRYFGVFQLWNCPLEPLLSDFKTELEAAAGWKGVHARPVLGSGPPESQPLSQGEAGLYPPLFLILCKYCSHMLGCLTVP